MGRVYLIYTHDEKGFVRSLGNALDDAGHAVWLENMQQDFTPDQSERLRRALRLSHLVVVLLSPPAIESPRLRQRLVTARRYDRPILPVLAEPITRSPFARVLDATADPDAAIARIVRIANRHLGAPEARSPFLYRRVFATLLLFGLVLLLLTALTLAQQPIFEVVESATQIPSPIEATFTRTTTPTVTATSTPSATPTQTRTPTATLTPVPETPTPAGIPFAAFSASPLQGNAPLTVTFTNESGGNIAEYRWDFTGDEVTDSTRPAPPPVTYNTPGIYHVTLTVTGLDGARDSTTTSIVVYGSAPNPLRAAFTAHPTTGSAPLTVRFTNQSAGNIMAYAWDFDGDGAVDSTDPNPASFTYLRPGTYTASLVVSDASGPSQPATTTITVSASNALSSDEPVASFSANPSDGNAPLTVSFVNWSLGSITGYAWDFDGDGTVDSTSANPPAFTYDTPGIYTAALVVSGPGGQSDPEEVSIAVYEYVPEAPISDFTAEPTSGPAPLTVIFTDKSTGEAAIVAWEWDFNGDGVIDSDAPNPPPYTYTTPGTYEASLLVYDDYGEGIPRSITITVGQPASATLTLTASPTATGTTTPTSTATLTPTRTPTQTPTRTPIFTGTPTLTATLTGTPTPTPSASPTSTASPTPTDTPTPSPTATLTSTLTSTMTPSSTPTSTPTPSSTPASPPTSTAVEATEETNAP